MIINAFKNKIFPLKDPSMFPEYVSEEDTLYKALNKASLAKWLSVRL